MKDIYVKRELGTDVLKYLNKREIIAIIGPRQCGKTTLLKNIFFKLNSNKKVFLDFEDRETLELFVNDVKSFAELYVKNNKYLFIDEFQYAKEGGKNLKYLFDNFKIKIFVSGSSSTELSIQSIKYLVGRIFVFILYPFSFDEFLSYKAPALFTVYQKSKSFSKEIQEKINQYYKDFLIYGGYPRVVLSKDNAEKELVLKNIFNTYILKEIKAILNFKEDYKLVKLMNALALQIGGIVNYEELTGLTGFKYKELVESINLLFQTFIVAESKPYYNNKRTELVKSPKIFFIDNGFRNTIIKNFQRFESRTDIGELNENFVASEILKEKLALNYWRTKSNAEVDFVVRINDKLIPIEAKSHLSRAVITKSFYSFIERYAPPKAAILSLKLFEKQKFKNTKIDFVPHWFLRKITNLKP